jgi:hypothetical protein
MYAMMIIIRHRQRDSYSSIYYIIINAKDVAVDKCVTTTSGAPTPTMALPTALPTKASTDAPTALTTKSSNCLFADGKPGTKCDGLKACEGIDTSNIGCGSCNGYHACNFSSYSTTDKVIVKENSCNGADACVIHIHQVVRRGGSVVIGKGSW